MMKHWVFAFAFLAASGARSQSTIGLPAIRNYPGAGAGIWDIGQDNLGRLYFANDGGQIAWVDNEDVAPSKGQAK